MSNHNYDGILEIGEGYVPTITVEEGEKVKPLIKQTLDSYLLHKETKSLDVWLREEFARYLPEYPAEQIESMGDEIIETLKAQEEKQRALEDAVANGRSKESWFAGEVKRATSFMGTQESAKYLQILDNALDVANDALNRTIHIQNGAANMNPHLDGFIAEQYHAQTFNLNAEATGSPYRAKVLEPTGQGYVKNSVDLVIVDADGKVVRRYQSKYCKDAEATSKAFEKGDYRGQRKLVPEGQEADVGKKSTSVIEAPDGTTSNPLSKERAKELQVEAQSGKWNDLNWNEYQIKDLAVGVGKQAGKNALLSAAIGVGFNVAEKVWNGEKIDGDELVETALKVGADTGVKTAVACGLKISAEKGLIRAIPPGTPAGTVANIVHVAAENAKIIMKVARGELKVRDGFEKMEQVTVATVAGISASVKGAAIGAAIGTVFGMPGQAAGGLIGGTIGYLAGSKVGETVVKTAQKIRTKAREAVSWINEKRERVRETIRENIPIRIPRPWIVF